MSHRLSPRMCEPLTDGELILFKHRGELAIPSDGSQQLHSFKFNP